MRLLQGDLPARGDLSDRVDDRRVPREHVIGFGRRQAESMRDRDDRQWAGESDSKIGAPLACNAFAIQFTRKFQETLETSEVFKTSEVWAI